jgi:hypothetical protein
MRLRWGWPMRLPLFPAPTHATGHTAESYHSRYLAGGNASLARLWRWERLRRREENRT